MLSGIDYVELWVGNARQAAWFFSSAFGFGVSAYAGPETGVPDVASYVLEQGEIRLVVSGALRADSELAAHVQRHGDGVRDIAFRVDDARDAFRTLLHRGATPARPPWTAHDSDGDVTRAAIAVYGDTRHVFVDRSRYHGVFLPGFKPVPAEAPGAAAVVALGAIDHIVANVEQGSLECWVDFYERTFGFDQLRHFGADRIHTQYSALASTVVWDHDRVVLPINEPAQGLKKSQIEEFLQYYGSPGVQHLALRTSDIVSAVRAMRARGVRFLDVPPDYYDSARKQHARLDLPWPEIEELGILFDRERHGYLLQIFTESIADRPTLFLEIIQREGATGFGEGNFRALFEAIERAQARRGNL
jgi:4-hydroxyphenylpyruvate dioxygenase